jgi:hypothetical protein
VARLKNLEQYLDQTYFAWIGGFELGDPYYYRLHSAVAFCVTGILAADYDTCSLTSTAAVSGCECDPKHVAHCSIAVFLTNTSPAKCHIHTINRLPNAGDYGKTLLRQWRDRGNPCEYCYRVNIRTEFSKCAYPFRYKYHLMYFPLQLRLPGLSEYC